MIDFNLPNFITIGLIAVIAIVAIRVGTKAINKPSPV
jgi:hypothetical protein